jgi:hypothetical protein
LKLIRELLMEKSTHYTEREMKFPMLSLVM